MAANINRVVLVGNLTRDPELRHTPGGTPVCSLRIAVNSRRKDESGQWVDKPNYFSISVFGNQAESCAQYLVEGPPRRDRRPARLARVGGEGRRRQARVRRDRRRQRPVPRQPRRRRRAAAAATSSCRRARLRVERRLPGLDRRRHPVLGETMAPARRQTRSAKRPGGPAGAIKRRNCYFCKEKVAEIDYKNVTQLRRYISEKGKIRSRRITGACRRHQVQVATAVKRAREMALLPYVAEGADDRERGGGRGRRDARSADGGHPPAATSRRSASAATSSRSLAATPATSCFPRRLAEEATTARVAELQKRDAQRARHEAKTADEAQAIAGDAREDRAALRGEGRPDRLALRLGHADRHRRRDLEDGEGPRRPAEDRRRQHQADRPLRGADRPLPGRPRRREDASSSRRAASCPPSASSRRWRPPRRRRPSRAEPAHEGPAIEELLLAGGAAGRGRGARSEPPRPSRLARRRRRSARAEQYGERPHSFFMHTALWTSQPELPAGSGRSVHSRAVRRSCDACVPLQMAQKDLFTTDVSPGSGEPSACWNQAHGATRSRSRQRSRSRLRTSRPRSPSSGR